MTVRKTTVCLLLVVGLVGCDESPTAPTPITPITSVVSQDFNGQVLVATKNGQQPIVGVTVTIITGPRAGESVQTNQDGHYSFPEFDGDEIHLRLEKDGYETKEAIVHRTEPITLLIPAVRQDFTGQVLVLRGGSRQQSQPIAGVAVTIITGPRAGESVQTNQDGRYSFPEFDGDELHLRLEKNGYETKEVIVHRTKPTTLPDRLSLLYNGPPTSPYRDPQNTPGVALVSIRWPDYIRPAFRMINIMPDPFLHVSGRWNAYSNGGVIEVTDLGNKNSMTHEICHSQQHHTAVIIPDAPYWLVDLAPLWDASPAGQAYREATEADIRETGRDEFPGPNKPKYRFLESAAEVCASWLGIRDASKSHREYLRRSAPNRLKWADEWLPKR